MAAVDLIIFGASGDLSARKLFPALFQLERLNLLEDDLRIAAVARTQQSLEDFLPVLKGKMSSYMGNDAPTEEEWASFTQRFSYVSVNFSEPDQYGELRDWLDDDRVSLFYFATPPSLFAPICEHLSATNCLAGDCRIVVEKPIGENLESSVKVNETLAKYFDEKAIYRIDHYLGKETVQNLMALRFANSLYEPLWNNAQIDHVQITVAEDIGVGSRGGYYDQAGALRDMVQNHLLQLLCLVAMEPPESYQADAIRDEKLKVLRALKPMDEERAQKCTVRGQYTALTTDSGRVPAYVDEIEADASSTETFVALKLEVGNWRWAGVPFYLRTGKRLSQRVSEIVVAFKPIPHSIFPSRSGALHSNKLVIRLQPDEGVMQWIMIKDPGPGGMRLRHVPLDMSFAQSFNVRHPDAYERLLMDVLRGNQTLFMRRDEVEAAWRWIDPILAAWADRSTDVHGYTAGTWGPSASIGLIERDGRTWHESI